MNSFFVVMIAQISMIVKTGKRCTSDHLLLFLAGPHDLVGSSHEVF